MVTESALREHRLDSIKETSDGSIDTSSDFVPFADIFETSDWTPDIPIEPRQGVGDIDAQTFDRGTETHTFTVTFHLQGSIAATTDTDVNAWAVYEALTRLAGNVLQRRTIVERAILPNAGAAGAGRHIYTVARHAAPNSITLSGDPAAGTPITVELEYMAPRIRPFLLDQPDTAETLDVSSSVSEDGDVTISGNDGTSDTSETVTLSAGSATTTSSFAEIYAVEAQQEFQGDLTVSMSTAGTDLMTIPGLETYQGVSADLGIPPVPDTQERITTHGGSEQKFLGNSIDRGGSGIAEEINSQELEVANNVESQATNDQYGEVLEAGPRDITLSATLRGQNQTHTNLKESLQEITADIVWTLDDNTLTLTSSAVTDPGTRVYENEENFLNTDVEFTAQELNIT